MSPRPARGRPSRSRWAGRAGPLTLLLLLACGEAAPLPRVGRADASEAALDAGPDPLDAAGPELGPSDAGPFDTRSDCDDDPQACGPGRLRGAAPGCTCLDGCLPGYDWDGRACRPRGDGGAADTGTAEAGLADGAIDAGIDGGVDAALPDSGPRPDAGHGFGQGEGEPCAPTQDDCRRVPGLVCEPPFGGVGDGTCMTACDPAIAVGGPHPACSGPELRCLALGAPLGAGPAAGRCVRPVEAYGTLDPRDRLSVCRPAPNVRPTPPVAGAPAVCLPLCSLVVPPVGGVALACVASGPLPACRRDQTFEDGRGNVYGTCTATVPRGGVCGSLRGLGCLAADRCVLSACRERLGAVCAGAGACAEAGERCVEIPSTGGAVEGLCQPSCDPFSPGDCGPDGACTLTSSGAAGMLSPYTTCRGRSGRAGQRASCADAFGVGSERARCDEGFICLPQADGWRDAVCARLCDPAAPARVACDPGSRCIRANAPYGAWGVCF